MSDSAKLISPNDSRLLYDNLENVLGQMYFDIHAIYEPDGNGLLGDCYCAAVDLFSFEFTFRVYFKIKDDGNLKVEHVERWHFG